MEANFELHDLLDEDLMLLRGVDRARRNRHMGMLYLQYEHFDLQLMEDVEYDVEFITFSCRKVGVAPNDCGQEKGVFR